MVVELASMSFCCGAGLALLVAFMESKELREDYNKVVSENKKLRAQVANLLNRIESGDTHEQS